MSTPESLALLYRLWDRTVDGRIAWEPSSGEREFATRLGPYMIVIAERDDPDYPDQPDYELRLHNDEGRWIETISNVTLRPYDDQTHQGMNPYAVLQALHRRAQRSALGVDQAIRDILGLLKDGSSPPASNER
jgi:hypothetical protein